MQKHWSKVCFTTEVNKTIACLYKQVEIHFLKKILLKNLAHLVFNIKIRKVPTQLNSIFRSQ